MGTIAQYKKYNRGKRQANVETDFSSGMMYSEGAIPEGYVKTLVNFDFTLDNNSVLKPRAGHRLKELILPDMSVLGGSFYEDEFLSVDTVIKYSKECIEDGSEYKQFIFGKLDEGSSVNGKIWVVTAPKIDGLVTGVDHTIDFSNSRYDVKAYSCKYYSTELAEIHGVKLSDDVKTAFPVGTFVGNSFYFFDTTGNLVRTAFNSVSNIYEFDNSISPIVPKASEAVNYGYNMLRNEDTYEFANGTTASTMQMEGILPYDSDGSNRKLLMQPKKNSRIYFECYYDVVTTNKYKIVWSWKEVASDGWTVLKTVDSWSSASGNTLRVDFNPPSSEIMVRCEAYRIDGSTAADAVEKAITVGFDFSVDEHGSISNLEPEIYDLSTSTGMFSWKNRLVLWGVPKDPTILFISDLNEPYYFPYPNNITVFDEPIVNVTELMDSLIVFTRSKIHQVSLNEDGTTWTATVIQSNLYIEAWDKHLIQSVRNMVYFKSGNYYYMLVPKAQSTTGELTLAPITTPITEFFNKFSRNVSEIFLSCFRLDDGTTIDPTHDELGNSNLITYYNFLDYEFIHNIYVYKYLADDAYIYVHFDITYNTVGRYWKICIYEAPHILYPFRNDATQRGLTAATSVMDFSGSPKRVVQIFEIDETYINDLYIPVNVGYSIDYDASHEDIIPPTSNVLELPSAVGYVNGSSLVLTSSYVRESLLSSGLLEFLANRQYIGGFNVVGLADYVSHVPEILDSKTVFPNRQFLDTGYRDSSIFINKRYRELQLEINNLDNVDMNFGMSFRIAGEPRNTDFLYEVSQEIDELYADDTHIAYLDSIPYFDVPSEEIHKVNQWTLKHSLNSDISLWKVRAAISGKGAAPRMRLSTRNQFNYQLLGINWVYREQNMR